MITVPLKLYIHVRKSIICYLDQPQERTLDGWAIKVVKLISRWTKRNKITICRGQVVQWRTKHSSIRASVIA